MAWVHAFANDIYWTDLKRGPGTENQMIKCPLFLTEQISHTQMQMAERGHDAGNMSKRRMLQKNANGAATLTMKTSADWQRVCVSGGVSHFQSLGSGHNIFLPGCWARHEDWLTRSWLLKCSCPGWGRPGHRSHFISWLTEGAQFACFL